MSSRRLFLASGLTATGLAVTGCAKDADLARGTQASTAGASASQGASSAQQTASATPTGPDWTAKAKELSLDQQVGQLFMMGHSSGTLGDAAALAEEHHLGWLLLLGDAIGGRSAVSLLASEVSGLSLQVPMMMAVDQEGGRIQRLKGSGFATIPPATEQARLKPAELTAKWQQWGSELRRAGVHYNLAPVADVVPDDLVAKNAPIGQLKRHYGTGAMAAGDLAAAAIAGLHKAKVATSVKHFPGLGKVTTNTDLGEAIDTVTTADDPDLRSFRATIDAGVASVMVSSAIYQKIDPKNQAAFSSKIVTDLLRGTLGWQGVVISDDLGAAASVQHIPAAERAMRFLQAGGDVVINANPAIMATMVGAALDEARKDAEFADRVAEKCGRVLALKERFG